MDYIKSHLGRIILVVLLLASLIGVYFVWTSGNHSSENSKQNGITNDDAGQKDDQNGPVSKAEAEKIVIDKYGGTIKNIESDSYNGKSAWEVEVRDSNEGRIEVKIDKNTGEILELE